MLNPEEKRRIAVLAKQHGLTVEVVRAELIRAGLASLDALGVLTRAGPMTVPHQASQGVPGLDVLRRVAAPLGIDITSVQPGRPTLVTVAARMPMRICGIDASEWGVDLDPDDPVLAVLSFASRRSGNNAAFAAASFLDDADQDSGSSARAKLFFFVLEEEARVWVASRAQLRDTYRRIHRNGRVRRITSPREGTLRLLFPKKAVSMELHLALENPT